MNRFTRLSLAAIALLLILGCIPLLLAGCAPAVQAFVDEAEAMDGETLLAEVMPKMVNHSDEHGPLFKGSYATAPAPDNPSLVVASYNLRYGEAITETIRAYREAGPLPAADVILLQEMDEQGVRAIAAELGYNYVYYPASVAEDGDNFGNAILARWPISEPQKVILPGLHPLTGQQRTATRAVVTIAGIPVLVYSTHIEVATAPLAFRQRQFAAILDDIPDDAAHVIVGGDFNVITNRGVNSLIELFSAQQLAHATSGLGPTFTRFGLQPAATDHIFVRGFEIMEAGVLRDVTASDHFPIWARLSRPDEN
jgi:endonuclease/exonuclease/phosphatase family metal-dependent hydrolase